jgi:hypothetical protein
MRMNLRGPAVDIWLPHKISHEPHALALLNYRTYEALLQCNLVGRMIEFLLLKPAKMTSTPSGLARKDPTAPEHKYAYLLTMHTQRFNRNGSRAHEITPCFMTCVRNPHGC